MELHKSALTEKQFITEDDLFEMVHLVQDDTGVEYPIWVGHSGEQHAFHVKVSNFKAELYERNECFTLSVSSEPEVVAGRMQIRRTQLVAAKRWVALNREVLHEMDTALKSGGSIVKLLTKLKSINV